MHYIRDCIWGDIPLSNIEYELVQCFEMQRLNYLKQLHFVYFVYPSATHTRFSHSLGTLYVAKKVVKDSNLPLSKHEKEILYAASLLHDVGHSAFAHVIESLEQLAPHEDVMRFIFEGKTKEYLDDDYFQIIEENTTNNSSVKHNRIIKLYPLIDLNKINYVYDVLEKHGILNDVFDVLNNNYPVLSSMISSEIDIDHLDYIRRDSHYLGFPSATYDSAIFTGFKIEAGYQGREIVFRNAPAIISAIEDIIYSRWYLFKNAYFHHAVLSANAMLQKVIQILLDEEIIPYLVGDIQLLNLLIEYARIKQNMPEFLHNDFEKYNRKRVAAGNLAERLIVRDLFKRAYGVNVELDENPKRVWNEIKTNNTKLVQFNELIDQKSGGECLFGHPLIPPLKNYEKVKIEGKKNLIEVADFNIEQYKERYRKLHVLFVYSKDDNLDTRKRMNNVCKEIFVSRGFYKLETEVPIISSLEYSTVREFFLKAEKNVSKSTFKVLSQMEANIKYSLNDLAKIINISSISSISRNFKKLLNIQKNLNIELISTSFSRRPIHYYLKPEIYNVFKEVIGNYV